MNAKSACPARHAPSIAVRSVLAAALVVAASAPASAQNLADLKTAPEATDFRETTRHAAVVEFMEAVAAASPVIQLDTFGYTLEGRPLPFAVVGRVRDTSPAAVRATGRTVVYLQGNIHAGEVEGKEVLLQFLREVAQGQHQQLLDSLVLLVAPIYNADGNERVLLTNRPSQNGPIGGMGQRPNAQDYDLNRDHMKLDSPEARSLIGLMNDYDPHVGVDLHTTNGTRHGYHLTYSPPLHPNTPPVIDRMLRDRWLLEVTTAVRDKYGWHYYHYGNVSGGGGRGGRGGRGGGRGATEQVWATFDHRPRFNNNYIGLRNRFGILSEAFAYATFEDRILATYRFVDEVLAFAYRNAAEIRQATERADASVVGEQLAVRSEPARSDQPVVILMGDVQEEINPFSGQRMLRRLDVLRPDTMYEAIAFRAAETERAPAAYLIPPDARIAQAIDRIGAHGVQYRRLDAPAQMNVQAFRVSATSTATNVFQGHNERTIEGAWADTTMTVPAGTIVVPVDQPLGRLAFTLLEPRSDDGLANWNFFDRVIDADSVYPVLRTLQPPPVGDGDAPRVRLSTALGDIVLEIDSSRAPTTAANFLRYVDAGAYDGGRFHRTVRDDNQPSDAVLIDVVQAGTRRGRDVPRFAAIPLERTTVTGLRHADGTLSMARAGPDTATSDFFITIGAQPSLDFGGARNADGQGFAAFGRVVEGMETVHAIHRAAADRQSLTPPIDITRAVRIDTGRDSA